MCDGLPESNKQIIGGLVQVFSIDIKKLDKSKFIEGKNGALYCNFVVFENDEPDKFGNTHIVRQGVSKEDRQAGVKMPIIGNGKDFGDRREKAPAHQHAPTQYQGKTHDDDNSQIPF